MSRDLDAGAIAAMDPDALEAVFRDKPALHRYPGVDGQARARPLPRTSSSTTAGAPKRSGTDATSGEELLARMHALPGFGKDKSRIFVGLLGKRLGVRPPGWEQVAADWPSIADVDTFERVGEIREKKRAAKAAKKAAARPQEGAEAGHGEGRGASSQAGESCSASSVTSSPCRRWPRAVSV